MSPVGSETPSPCSDLLWQRSFFPILILPPQSSTRGTRTRFTMCFLWSRVCSSSSPTIWTASFFKPHFKVLVPLARWPNAFQTSALAYSICLSSRVSLVCMCVCIPARTHVCVHESSSSRLSLLQCQKLHFTVFISFCPIELYRIAIDIIYWTYHFDSQLIFQAS